MKLKQLLNPWIKHIIADCDIHHICNDSRQVKPGDLFLAYPGALADGRLYIEKARQAGATAIAYDPHHLPADLHLPDALPCVPVPHLSHFLAAIASRFYQDPTRGLSVTGVTGTNGKTTIAYQLAQAHTLLGETACYMGTLGQGRVSSLQPLMNTTPDALCLQRLCAEYLTDGVKQLCMEVSSHALCEHRVDHVYFKQAIYTNLTQDHLDYHRTMQAYAEAKARLFAYPSLEWVIVNQDDPYVAAMLAKKVASCQTLTYGVRKASDIRATHTEFNLSGSFCEVTSPWGTHRLHLRGVGEFNIYNGLAVFASLMAHGYRIDDVVTVMTQLRSSPGRLELVADAPCVLVDYAHTPDALENVLKTLSQLKAHDTASRKLWVVFGCGGDRDRTKRPMMGKIAQQWADQVILTSDNPRTEDPELILAEIAAGFTVTQNMQMIVDRKEAIHHVLAMADKHDIVLIAGKGHESYQQIGQQRFPFSDQDVVRKYLSQ